MITKPTKLPKELIDKRHCNLCNDSTTKECIRQHPEEVYFAYRYVLRAFKRLKKKK